MKISKLIIYLILIPVIFSSCNKEANDTTIELVEKKINSVLPPSVVLIDIEESNIEGLYELKFQGMKPLYAFNEGDYLISGDIYMISDGNLINTTNVKRDSERKKVLSELDLKEAINFSGENSKYSVFIFTDVECIYCRKLHSQIEDYIDAGISINYLAFPRSGLSSESFNKMVTAWCSDNPKQVLTSLKLGVQIEENLCNNNPVEKHFNLGKRLGVGGTPSIITKEGKLIPGYVSPEELLKQLEI